MMKLFTYGTLMRSEIRHSILKDFGCVYEGKCSLAGYKLYHNLIGEYPVALNSKSNEDVICGELYTLGKHPDFLLSTLDQIEGTGIMYNRIVINDSIIAYIGISEYWNDYLQYMVPFPNGYMWSQEVIDRWIADQIRQENENG